jgi:hypothetical protein
MLVKLLSAQMPEAAQFLDVRPLFKESLVFELGAVLRVVSHQELGEEDAGVEALTDRRINHSLVLNNAVDFLGELLEGRYEHWVQFLREVDVVMLLAVRQVNDLSLQLQKRLHKSNVEVVTEEIHVFFLVLAVLRVHILRVVNLSQHSYKYAHLSAPKCRMSGVAQFGVDLLRNSGDTGGGSFQQRL